jgi:hypothetical protein
MVLRSLGVTGTVLGLVLLCLGCAGGPSLISSTPDAVAVEFPSKSTVSSASVMAQKACKSYGKVAAFDSVDATASPKTRVAKFDCVPVNGSGRSSNRD